MKVIQKILIILVMGAYMFAIMPQNISWADVTTPVSPSTAVQSVGDRTVADYAADASDKLATTIGKLLGFLQVASGLISILMIALTGFNYIIATPDVKEEMKKKMLPIIVGLVIVFGAVSIARFILGAVGAA